MRYTLRYKELSSQCRDMAKDWASPTSPTERYLRTGDRNNHGENGLRGYGMG